MFRPIVIISIFLSFSVKALTITSLNIEWYGRGGTLYGSSQDEYRDRQIKDFLENQIPKSDVFVFQEVTDTQRLSKMFPEYTCSTYEVKNGGHQHVSICVDTNLSASFSVDREVQVGRSNLRPAYAAKLKSGINVIGLHLKAGTKETDLRIQQIEKLVNSPLTDPKLNPRTIIIGDFNTFESDRTMREVSDVDLMDEIFELTGFNRTAHNTPTYIGFGARTFDRIWSRGLVVKRTEVFGPCRRDSVAFPYSQRGYFERFVSDHCALQVEVQL
jgi:endonuclease/exonuclease/phosphatase family metal-dependent hydrolase